MFSFQVMSLLKPSCSITALAMTYSSMLSSTSSPSSILSRSRSLAFTNVDTESSYTRYHLVSVWLLVVCGDITVLVSSLMGVHPLCEFLDVE